ncbi:MAG: transcriptional repressor NrdR [SAR324 cluster bacterium]|uniref:Transcriptional repressor NrdR n=1 Tax=SAR324 cluster bacterium TaxID=2024889 RepID=A0A7X9IKB9_9DELT|nr:transcriptional repressor NrdR [SAR324 cluster bacterium]
MRCTKCNSDELSVIDSRSDGQTIRRRRECQKCGIRFTTYERIELALPLVIKKDGRREPFDREKIKTGILRACMKRPLSIETIDETVEGIEKLIAELCEKEISSLRIGDFVMEALKDLDKVAYIRFASVYREFSDVHHFVEALKALDATGRRMGAKQIAKKTEIE